jgi:putative colanic acid biosynthesis acetyltransferase WcaF
MEPRTTPQPPQGATRLDSFRNDWYDPGRGVAVRLAWIAVNGTFLLTSVPWPSRMKAWLLRAFGARVGAGVVLKPRINVKYPWNVTIGDHSWIGEGVWIDSLAKVTIGANCCLSQGVTIETGNHDWSRPTFDLVLNEVVLEDGAWAAVKSLLLPGARLRSHAVLGAGGVLSGDTLPYSVFAGNPAKKVKDRFVRPEDTGEAPGGQPGHRPSVDPRGGPEYSAAPAGPPDSFASPRSRKP